MNSPARPLSNLAVVSLCFGVASWVLLPLLAAIVAIFTGHMARSEIRRSQGETDGDGLALAGLILGYANLALMLVILIGIVMAVLGVFGVAWYSGL